MNAKLQSPNPLQFNRKSDTRETGLENRVRVTMELVVYIRLFISVIWKRQIWMFKNYQSKYVREKCAKWKDEGTGEKMEGNTEHKEHAETRIIESRQVNIMEDRVHRTNNAETVQICITQLLFKIFSPASDCK